MTDVFQDEGCDVCAREAAAAIDVVLDQRCPELKLAFWRAVERYYRRNTEPDEGPPAAPGVNLADRCPASPR
ncbi:hypothetical protein ACFQE0_20960 [Methylobacterium komagatae]|uniref:Uncharacterized protein n=1 Tax=Methylobacterium komagatae TaxID=374425 RepID=A0ABW2BQK3_9HYPH